MKKYASLLLLVVAFSFWGCNSLNKLNLFSIEEDMALGLQVSEQIESDSKQFPILDEKKNKEVYRYIRNMTNKILNSGNVQNKDKFAWQVKIIDDSETLNAFCTPGGYIYVYTGLIKYLDSADQLAGVMGHEIAHAALRHSTRQMTKIYGTQVLASLARKEDQEDPGMLEQIAVGLASLKFSRAHETEADEHSVKYLCGTSYHPAGAAGFFKKIGGKDSPPAFLSTHPNPSNRVEHIEQRAASMSCKGNKKYKTEYARIKKLLK